MDLPPPGPAPKADVRTGARLDTAHSPSTDDYYPDVSKRLEEVGNVVIKVCLDDAGKMTGAPTVGYNFEGDNIKVATPE